jgi:diguanylate cyclase (GGDEF)-like protein
MILNVIGDSADAWVGAMKAETQRRLERCTNLPSLPWAALRILELCQLEDLDLGQVSEVIERDPALAAKLVRTANSPLFAVRGEITSISGAVALLGVNAVRTLVLSFSLARECGAKNQAGLHGYWRRSLLAAVAAREMCAAAAADKEEAFLSALLQDIGMLAFARGMGGEYAGILAAAGPDHDLLSKLEVEAFGADHAEAGAWLMERWKLPRRLAQVVGASHEPGRLGAAGQEDVRALAAIVSLSGRLADLWAGDQRVAALALRKELDERWGSGAVDIKAVSGALLEQGPQLAGLFDVDLDAREMALVLDQAQEALLALSVRTTKEVQHIHEALTRLESRTAALLAEAHADPLTGLANRWYTDSYLAQVFEAAVESSRMIGVIYVDLDDFKNVNDSFGHAAGDLVLKSIALCLRASVRGGDYLSRYGGDEFVIILRADDAQEVEAVAERIRSTIAERPHSVGHGRTVRLTASLGWALLEPAKHHTPQELVEDADNALYAAKRGGRNRVCGGQAAAIECR